jgi:hypothetical protein
LIVFVLSPALRNGACGPDAPFGTPFPAAAQALKTSRPSAAANGERQKEPFIKFLHKKLVEEHTTLVT